MTAAYARAANGKVAFQLMIDMQCQNVRPDKFTFISVISACVKSTCLNEGKITHFCLVYHGLDHVGDVGNALITLYGTFGHLDDALRTLEMMSKRNVVSWNAIFAVYCQYGHGEVAFQLYTQMQQEGIEPNKVSFITLLTACSTLAKLDEGKKIHALIQISGIKLDVVLGTALVDMYSKCGDFEAALKVFTEMPAGNVVSWTAIISAHVKHGYDKEARALFRQMHEEGVKANKGTLLTLLETCASAGNLADGKLLHACIVDDPDDTDNVVENALISMYNRCGSLEDACAVFNNTAIHDTVSWNALISANSQHGHSKKALELFLQMQRKGIKPTENTFISVLSACSHTGLLSQGLRYFDFMCCDCGFVPVAQHYTCMIDLLGRAGLLEEAEELVDRMPLQPGVLEWMSLVSSCRVHGYMDKARCAAKQALELDPLVTGAYVALSNILASIGRWDDETEVSMS